MVPCWAISLRGFICNQNNESILKIERALLALLALFTLNSELSTASAQGTAFTYQGQLQNSGSPANGTYDFSFALYNGNNTNTDQQLGPLLIDQGVSVSNGLFVVTLNFGDFFTGTNNWLSIGVCSNGASTFTALSPLQELTPTPYAIYAPNAGTATNISGIIANTSLPASPSFSGTVTATSFSGNGGGLTNLNASQLTNGTVADARLSTNVALLDKAQAFTGANTFNNNVAVATGSGAQALNVSGSTTGGFGSPLSLIQNTSTAANAGPALRVVGNGTTPNGVLSVSSQGTGLIAQFGNASSFVSSLDTNGNWTANSYNGTFNGNGAGLTNLPATLITNSTTNPVPVINVAGLSPYVDEVLVTFASGAITGTVSNYGGMGLTVPTGKTLVVENVSGFVYGSDSGDTYQVLIGLACNGYTFQYACSTLSIGTGITYPGFTQQMKHYADPGSTIGFLINRSTTTAATSMYVQFSGYLINNP
jgi:hypothetical protein